VRMAVVISSAFAAAALGRWAPEPTHWNPCPIGGVQQGDVCRFSPPAVALTVSVAPPE